MMKAILTFLIAVFIIVGIFAKVKSIQYKNEYELLVNYNQVSIPVDFSRPGKYEAEFVHILKYSSMFCFQLICDLSGLEKEVKGELESFKGYYQLTNMDGSNIEKTEYCDFTKPIKLTIFPENNNVNPDAIDVFQDEGRYGDAYFPTGTYKIKIVVEEGAACLEGKEQQFIAYYFEVMSNEDIYSFICNVFSLAAFGLTGGVMLALIIVSQKSKSTFSE